MKAFEPWYHQPDVKFGASAGAVGSSGARQAGIVYHRKFYNVLKMHASVALPGIRVLIEPWFKSKSGNRRSPDAVLIDDTRHLALVVEVKLNWKGGRDAKLLDEYLPLVSRAFDLPTRPLLVAGSIINLQQKPLLGLGDLPAAWDWKPGDNCPTMLWTGK